MTTRQGLPPISFLMFLSFPVTFFVFFVLRRRKKFIFCSKASNKSYSIITRGWDYASRHDSLSTPKMLLILDFWFFKWAFFRLFSVFSSKQYNFNNKSMWKMSNCPSSIRHRDLNPWPLGHESSPITTRPGLIVNVFKILLTLDLT